MQKYEYTCACVIGGGKRTTRILNEYGREGWELIASWFTWFYFKRPLR